MPKRKRRITKASIKFISLVPRGANKMPVIFKADGSFQTETLIKDEIAEKGELTAVVYAPEIRDSQGDIASADVCRQMCHDFAKNGGQIDIQHNGEPVGRDAAFVAENFIVQKGDPRFEGMTDYDGNPVDVTGAWATVIKIDSEDLRKTYRAGEWNGVSMGGTATVVEEPEDIGKAVADALAKAKAMEDQMKPEDIQKIAEAVSTSLVTVLKNEGLLNQPEPAAPPATTVDEPGEDDEAPVFKGDPTDKAALEKHLRALNAWNLRKTVDFNDPAAVEALLKSDETLSAKDREIQALQARLAKLQKGSNQPAGSPPETQTEMQKCVALGSTIAAIANGAQSA